MDDLNKQIEEVDALFEKDPEANSFEILSLVQEQGLSVKDAYARIKNEGQPGLSESLRNSLNYRESKQNESSGIDRDNLRQKILERLMPEEKEE